MVHAHSAEEMDTRNEDIVHSDNIAEDKCIIEYSSGNPNHGTESFLTQPFEALNGRYTIVEKIGHGAQAHVFKARDEHGEFVAIKVFDFRLAEDWKSVELLRREVGTIQSLTIEGIPKYIDFIEAPPFFYLIESYINACSLKHKIEISARFDEIQLLEIIEKTLVILNQLHTRMPPVIHRDIKPANLLIDIKDETIQIWIVDFGSVTAVYQSTRASTLAGTAGYAAPEQLFGRATPASDIYGLGMTMLHLATGTAPYDMEMDGLTLNFKKYLPPGISPGLVQLLTEMIQPNPLERIQNTSDALDRVTKLKTAALASANADDYGNCQSRSDGSYNAVTENDDIYGASPEISAAKECQKVIVDDTEIEHPKVDYRELEFYASQMKGFSKGRKRYVFLRVWQDTHKPFEQILNAYEAVEAYAYHTDSRYFTEDDDLKADYYIEFIEKELSEPGYYEQQYRKQRQRREEDRIKREQRQREDEERKRRELECHKDSEQTSIAPVCGFSKATQLSAVKTYKLRIAHMNRSMLIGLLSCFVGMPLLAFGSYFIYLYFGPVWTALAILFTFAFTICAFLKKLKIFFIVAGIVAALVALGTGGYYLYVNFGLFWTVVVAVLIISIATSIVTKKNFGCILLAGYVLAGEVAIFAWSWKLGLVLFIISAIIGGISWKTGSLEI